VEFGRMKTSTNISKMQKFHFGRNDLVVDPKADLLPIMIPTGVEAEDKVPGKYIRHTK
jgi:hypothetical protein